MDKLLLYKALKNKSGAEISASGNPVTLSGTLADNPLKECKIYGWSKQETTTGKNLFNVSLLDDADVFDKSQYALGFWVYKLILDVGDYTVSVANISTSGKYLMVADSAIFGEGKSAWFAHASASKVTTVSFKNVSAIYFYFGTTIELVQQVLKEVGYIQVEKGLKATSYEPYTGGQPSPNPDYPQEIESVGSDGKIDVTVHGKNLFDLEYASDINNWKPGGYRYIPYYVGKGNKVSVSYSEKLPTGRGFYAVIGQSKGSIQRIYFWLYHSGVDIGKTQFTFTEEEDYIYLNVAGNNIVQSIKELKNLQIEVSPSPTSYEPYHTPQSLSIQTPTGLPAIPVTSGGNYTDASGQQWIADYIDLKRGKYVQNIRILELTGQEPYIVAGTSYFSGSSANMYIIASDMLKDGAVMCNCLSEKPYVWSIESAVGCTTNIQQVHLRLPKATIGVSDDAGLEETKTAYKNYIKGCYDAGKPIVVHYILAEPIERDLTPSEIQAYQNLVTYAGTTIVENDADCYMEVSSGGEDALRAKKLALILGD